MHDRAKHLISQLRLQPHPEGGYFREIFRSAHQVQSLDKRSARSALTTIYYLLAEGQHSRWHRIRSDEVWHFYEGDPLQLYWTDGQDVIHEEMLATHASNAQPVCVVPANCWQAAKAVGEYSLLGVTVGPGFDFQDFEMTSEDSAILKHIKSLDTRLVDLV